MIDAKWKQRLAGLMAAGGALVVAVARRGRGRQPGHEGAVTEPALQTMPATTPHPHEGDGSKEVHSDADAV